MKLFVATSYSSQVDYSTGKVNDDYKNWLESELTALESLGHEIFCSVRADGYQINTADPAEAFRLDEYQLKRCDALLAYVRDRPSAGVQTEIGYALALGKKVFIAHDPDHTLAYFNSATIAAGQATEITTPVANHLELFSS
jgi:hypothetical protein